MLDWKNQNLKYSNYPECLPTDRSLIGQATGAFGESWGSASQFSDRPDDRAGLWHVAAISRIRVAQFQYIVKMPCWGMQDGTAQFHSAFRTRNDLSNLG